MAKKDHQSCPICGHHKCLTVFSNGNAWCHSHNSDGDSPWNYAEALKNRSSETPNPKPQLITPSKPTGDVFSSLDDRKISEDTARKYGVKVVYNHEGKVAEHMYPYYSENTLTASKIRTVATKDFRWTGTQSEVGLFGENLFKSGGKFLTIVVFSYLFT